MFTLQDLKDKVEELENSLPSHIKAEDMPIKSDFCSDIENVEIETYSYLGHRYAVIEIS